jgi:hypothetical protein
MVGRVVWLVALALTLASVVCIGVMFAGGAGILLDGLRGGNLPFESVVSRIRAGRAWGIAGITLFVSALVLLWFRPETPGPPRGGEAS